MLESFISFTKEYPLFWAPFLGFIPAFIWLWFWLKEDIHPEPVKMITLSFIGGMVAVVLALPLQKIVYDYLGSKNYFSFLFWATIEETLKFFTVYFIALIHKKINDEPVDNIIYLIISALGFVALENTFFLAGLLQKGDLFGALITNNMRFVGAGLLHVVSSATVGICMALAFYKTRVKKILHVLVGLTIAIILHTSFNIYIMERSDSNLFLIFGVVWIGIIALLLLFEKVKHIKNNKA